MYTVLHVQIIYVHDIINSVTRQHRLLTPDCCTPPSRTVALMDRAMLGFPALSSYMYTHVQVCIRQACKYVLVHVHTQCNIHMYIVNVHTCTYMCLICMGWCARR